MFVWGGGGTPASRLLALFAGGGCWSLEVGRGDGRRGEAVHVHRRGIDDREGLIDLSKAFLETRGGLGADPVLLSDDFQFLGPVVGPLGKAVFVDAIGSVDFAAAFPDFQGEIYGFNVDPFETNRVWYTARGYGTNTGPLPPFAPEPTGKTLVNPPRVCSLTFNTAGLVTKYTIGYVVDRMIGNTGGLGGLYGVLYAIGKPLPFPEARPWKMSMRYAIFQKVGNLLSSFRKKK